MPGEFDDIDAALAAAEEDTGDEFADLDAELARAERDKALAPPLRASAPSDSFAERLIENAAIGIPTAAAQLRNAAIGAGGLAADAGAAVLNRTIGEWIREEEGEPSVLQDTIGQAQQQVLYPAIQRQMQLSDDLPQMAMRAVGAADDFDDADLLLGQIRSAAPAAPLPFEAQITPEDVVAAAGSLAPTVAAGPGGLPAMMAAAGAQSAGGTYADRVQQGKGGTGEALRDAVSSGAITAALMRLVPGGTEAAISRLFTGPMRRQTAARVLKEAGLEATEEGIDEFLQSWLINGQGLMESLRAGSQATALGGILGAGTNAPGAISDAMAPTPAPAMEQPPRGTPRTRTPTMPVQAETVADPLAEIDRRLAQAEQEAADAQRGAAADPVAEAPTDGGAPVGQAAPEVAAPPAPVAQPVDQAQPTAVPAAQPQPDAGEQRAPVLDAVEPIPPVPGGDQGRLAAAEVSAGAPPADVAAPVAADVVAEGPAAGAVPEPDLIPEITDFISSQPDRLRDLLTKSAVADQQALAGRGITGKQAADATIANLSMLAQMEERRAKKRAKQQSASLQTGDRVRFNRGKRKGTEATVVELPGDGLAILQTDGGKRIGGQTGVKIDGLDAVNKPDATQRDDVSAALRRETVESADATTAANRPSDTVQQVPDEPASAGTIDLPPVPEPVRAPDTEVVPGPDAAAAAEGDRAELRQGLPAAREADAETLRDLPDDRSAGDAPRRLQPADESPVVLPEASPETAPDGADRGRGDDTAGGADGGGLPAQSAAGQQAGGPEPAAEPDAGGITDRDRLSDLIAGKATEDATLYSPRRTPGEDPLQAPKARLGIEDLIRWTMEHRQKTVRELKQKLKTARNDEVRDDLRRTLQVYERVDPDELARHMREHPRHYRDAYADNGMDPVRLFAQSDRMPVERPRVQPAPVALPDGEWKPPSIRDNLRQLNRDLRKADRLAPEIAIDAGALPEDAGGQFDPSNFLVTVRYHNDLDTVAHEVGHWTGRRFDLLGAADLRPVRRELAELSVHGTGETDADRMMEEGIAEWFRAWMVNPTEADARAPEFSGIVKKRVSPEVLQALRRFGDDFRQWHGASAAGKEAAGIDSTAESVKRVVKDAAWHRRFAVGLAGLFGYGRRSRRRRKGQLPTQWKKDTKLSDRLKFNVTDDQAPALSNYLLAMQIAGFDPEKLTPTQHWDFMRKMNRGQGGRVRDGMLVHGLVNTDGTRATFVDGKPMILQNLVGELMERGGDQWAGLLDKAHAYGVAQRTGEIAARLRAQAENRVQKLAESLMEEALGDPFKEGIAAKRVAEFRKAEEKKLSEQLARLTGAGAGLESASAIAEDAVAELAKDPDRDVIEAYLDRYRQWASWNLGYLVESELLPPNVARRMRKQNEFYIDWHRMFGEDNSLVNVGESVEGSSRTIHNPLSSLLFATWSAVIRGDHNRQMIVFTDPLRVGSQVEGDRALARLGRKISAEEADRAFKDHDGYVDGPDGQQKVYRLSRVEMLMDDQGQPIFDEDGQPVYYRVSEPWVFESGTEASFEAAREFDSGLIMSVMQGLTAVQRTMITTSPSFRLRLLFRDNVEQVLLTENGSLGSLLRLFSPQGAKKIAGRSVDDWFAAYGADMAGYTAQDRDSLIGEIFAEAERLTKGKTAILRPTTAMRAWERIGRATENHARKREFAMAMRRYLKDGLPAEAAAAKAAIDSRELMDAAARGRIIGDANRAVLFLNAAVQGFTRTARPLTTAAKAYRAGDIGRGNRAMAAFLIKLGTYGSVLMAFRALQLMDLDDDDLEQELSRPAWKRDTTMLFRTPFGDMGVAKPYEWGWMGSGFERLADHLVAKQRGMDEHAKRAWEGYERSFAAAVWPVDADVFAPGFAPVIEVLANHSLYMDRPIVSQHEENLALERRDGQQSASEIGQLLGKIASADARNVDHLIRGYGGSWGSMATSRDWAEFTKRTTGLSGYTSPWQDRDVAWVMDNAQALGLDRRKPFQALRSLLHKASDGDQKARHRAINAATNLRARMEKDRDKLLNRL